MRVSRWSSRVDDVAPDWFCPRRMALFAIDRLGHRYGLSAFALLDGGHVVWIAVPERDLWHFGRPLGRAQSLVRHFRFGHAADDDERSTHRWHQHKPVAD